MTNEIPELIDDPDAPDIFSDGIAGIFFLNGNMRFTFQVFKANHSKSDLPSRRMLVGRVTMPLEQARALHKDLGGLLQRVAEAEQQTPQTTTSTVH